MIPVNCEENAQISQLAAALADMGLYLKRLEEGCAQIAETFYENKASAIDRLAQILEGLGYCSQLVHSAITLLALDAASDELSTATFNDGLALFIKNLDQAAISEDYSLLADLIEYDLPTVIYNGQELLKNLQQYCSEGNV